MKLDGETWKCVHATDDLEIALSKFKDYCKQKFEFMLCQKLLSSYI